MGTRTSSDVAATTSPLFTTETTNLPSTSRVETTSVADNDFTTQNQDYMTEEITESSMITSTYKTTPTDTSSTSTGFDKSTWSTTVDQDTKTTVQSTVESTTATAETTETTYRPVTSTASPSSGNGKLRLLYILLAIFAALILVLVADVLYCFRKRRSRMLLLESSGSDPSGKIVPIA